MASSNLMGVGGTHLSLLSAVFAGTALIQAASARLQPLDVHKLTTPVGFGTYLEPELLRRWRPVFAPLEPQKGWISRLQNVTARVYSQGRQDSVLALIFDSIGVTNCFAVEFGFDSPTYEGGSGSNTLFLHRAGGFQTLLLDGEFSNASINLHAHFLYANNVAELFHRYGVPQEPDFVSCDMDSHDAFVLRAILKAGFRPRVITAEYNLNWGTSATRTWTMVDPTLRTGSLPPGEHYLPFTCAWGASMGTLKAIADEFGYAIVAVVGVMDLVWIRRDVLDPTALRHVPTWDQLAAQVPRMNLLHAPTYPAYLQRVIDYGVWHETGSVDKAREAARRTMLNATVKHPCYASALAVSGA